MDKKFIWIGIGVAAIIAIVAVVLLSGSRGKGSQGMPDHEFEDWNKTLPDQAALRSEALTLFDQPNMLSYGKLLQMARTGRISLVSELWKLRRMCPKGMKRFACNIRIKQFILTKFKAPDNERLAALLTKYLRYEEIMTNFRIDEKDPKKRYEIIRQKRREFFGAEDAKLIFGLQEAHVSARSATKDFLTETKGMSGSERVKKYEEMRRKAYGDYYEAVVEREPKFNRYGMEMELRSTDLKALDGAKRTAYVRGMRERYFGKAGAARMAKVDQQINAQKTAESGYRKEAAALPAELSASERAERLKALRLKHFGKTGAAEFERREKYRLYLESQKKSKK